MRKASIASPELVSNFVHIAYNRCRDIEILMLNNVWKIMLAPFIFLTVRIFLKKNISNALLSSLKK